MFITFEGLDYSGKSTQVRRVAERLSRDGRSVLVVREPGGTALGEKIRPLLLDKTSKGMTDASEMLLFSASRAQLVAEVIKPALESGTIVVCDRFYDSTTAYQGWGRGLPLDAVRAINTTATSGLVPDITFFLDVPVEEIERRMKRSGTRRDRMESNDVMFHERVRRGYLNLADLEERFVVLDGLQPIEALHEELWSRLVKRLPGVSATSK